MNKRQRDILGEIKKRSPGNVRKSIPIIMVPAEPIVYDSVNKTQKPSVISIEKYCITTGFVFRTNSSSKIVAYCEESPEEVLAKVFTDYPVTSFEGYQFFGSNDLCNSTPLVGIGICGTDEFSGIEGVVVNGKISGLLKLKELVELKRDKPVTNTEVKRILDHVTRENHSMRTSPHYKQWKYDTQTISRVLRPYLKR